MKELLTYIYGVFMFHPFYFYISIYFIPNYGVTYMKKIYNLIVLVIYILLLVNMTVKFIPNIIAIGISLIVLIPAINARLDNRHKKALNNSLKRKTLKK